MENNNKSLLSKFYRLLIWLSNRQLYKRIVNHFNDYPYIWILFFLLLITAGGISPINWEFAKWIIRIVLLLFMVLLMLKPMNAVLGLIGSTGSIRLFFANFICITTIFAGIYQYGIFKNAGITYDINQPHIDYSIFADNSNETEIKISGKQDSLFFKHHLDSITFKETVIHMTRDTLHYQRINFMQVWQSSVLTTLTQGPADLFTIASVYNTSAESKNSLLDKQKSELFEWILIVHIIISWIFLGVFISLLYSKFCYES